MQTSAARVVMDAARRTLRTERPARAPSVVSARRRACVGRREKNWSSCVSTPVREKSHSPRHAASPAPRRRGDANLGALRSGYTLNASTRASLVSMPGGPSRAGAGVPAFRARHLANTAF